MKHMLLALILAVGPAATAWADTDPLAPQAEAPRHPADIDINSAASPYAPLPRDLAQDIRSRVLEAITEAIENNPEISAADKQSAGEKLRELREGGSMDIDIDADLGFGEAVIAALAVGLSLGMPVILVAAVLYAGHRKRRLVRDMVSEFIASGQPVPPEVWRGLTGDTTPRSHLNKGMILVGLGIGIFLCFWLMGTAEAAYLALIPLFIGIAQLLIWALERNRATPGA